MAIRVFEPQPLISGSEIVLGERNQQHLIRVLRMQAGNRFVIFNGDGGEYDARIVSAAKRETIIHIDMRREPATESALITHLGQVMSKGDRMEYAVQKAVELGVSQISLLSSTRCDVKLDADRTEKKREHLQMVAIAACEQSGRVLIPTVNAPLEMTKWVAKVEANWKVILHPASHPAIPPATATSIAMLVGPEGGLTADEIANALNSGFDALTLGPRVLRTETAPAAALAFLQARYGDFMR